MPAESFIRAMPKVELFLQLEGAFSVKRLLLIAEQNGVLEDPESLAAWQQRLEQPDPANRFELMAETSSWLHYEDDIAIMVYECALALARENVVYAEIHFNPAHFTEQHWSMEGLLAALNDGRRRAERAWKIQLRWVPCVFRNQPRYADELVRVASSAAGKDAGIVGVCLSGPEAAQPPGQFERAFRMAERKDIPMAVHSNEGGDSRGSLRETLELLRPQRLTGATGIQRDPELLSFLAREGIAVVVTPGEAVALGLSDSQETWPVKQLASEGLRLLPGSGMPAIYSRTLTQEYALLAEQLDHGASDLQEMVLDAVNASWLAEDEKADLAEAVRERLDALAREDTGARH